MDARIQFRVDDARIQFRVDDEAKRLAQQMAESQGRTLRRGDRHSYRDPWGHP